MDRETKELILSDAIDRAYREVEAATGAEMDTPEFRTLLENLTEMEWLLEKATGSCYVTPETPIQPAEPTDDPEPETPEPEKPAEPAPEPPPSPSPENAMSKEELREQVAALANKYPSLDAFALMQQMGYSKLSDIPAGRRAEYLALVKAAVEVA